MELENTLRMCGWFQTRISHTKMKQGRLLDISLFTLSSTAAHFYSAIKIVQDLPPLDQQQQVGANFYGTQCARGRE